MIPIFLILFFVISIFKCRNTYFSFLFFSILLASTDIGNLSIPFIWLTIIWGMYTGKLKFNKTNFFFMLFFLSIIVLLVSLSMFFNGAYLYNSIGTISKIAPVFVFLCISHDKLFFATRDVYLNIVAFIYSSFFGLFLYFIGYYQDEGVLFPRYSSFLYDANYFALFCFVFFIFIDYYKQDFESRNVFYLKSFLILFILLSQSLSILIFLMLYFFTSKNILFFISRFLNRYFYLLAIVFILFFLSGFEPYSFYDDWQDSYASLKFNSIIIRLNGIYSGFIHIKNDIFIFLFGMGSGRTLEIYDRVFHNLYFQELFDHGILYYSIMSVILYAKIKSRSDNEALNNVLFFLFINNLFFDNFYSFIFSFSFLIFSSKVIIKK